MRRCFRPTAVMQKVRWIVTLALLVNGKWAHTQELPSSEVNSIGMKLVAIPPGTFDMGSPIDEEGADNDELQHRVTIGKGFHLGVHEVTQEQFQKVMGENPSYFQKRAIRKADTGDHPVENVSWHQADQFCKRLSELPEEKSAGKIYRLPTEAEWEFACRAGTTTPYSSGTDKTQLLEYAWFADNGRNLTHPVGSKKPNALGLFDMHGNVWEWCQDWYADYPDPTPEDYAGPDRGARKVFRGGGWDYGPDFCRSALRNSEVPEQTEAYIGFRVVMVKTTQP